MLEQGHTVILNWSDKIIPLIREIAIANESAKGRTIVVLAEVDKQEMVIPKTKIHVAERGSE